MIPDNDAEYNHPQRSTITVSSQDLDQLDANLIRLRNELEAVEEELRPIEAIKVDISLKKNFLEQAEEQLKSVHRIFNPNQYAERKQLVTSLQAELDASEESLQKMQNNLIKSIEHQEALKTTMQEQEALYMSIAQGIEDGDTRYAATTRVEEEIPDHSKILSEYEKQKPERERLLIKAERERATVETLLQSVYQNTQELAIQESNQRSLKYAQKLIEQTVTFGDDEVTINHQKLALLITLQNDMERGSANIHRLRHRNILIRALDVIWSFLTRTPTDKQKAKAEFKQKKAAYDTLCKDISKELEATNQAVDGAHFNLEDLNQALQSHTNLDTLEAEIKELKILLDFNLEAKRKELIERCQPHSIHPGAITESRASNQAKQVLSHFLNNPEERTYQNLKQFLQSKQGKAALTDEQLMILLRDVGDIYSEVKNLLPQEEFLTIDATHMMTLASKTFVTTTEQIEELKLEKRELTPLTEKHQETVKDYELRIDQNTNALESVYLLSFLAKKHLQVLKNKLLQSNTLNDITKNELKDEIEALEIAIVKIHTKINHMKQALPDHVAQPVEAFFGMLDINKHDGNIIFLMRHYSLEMDAFYQILSEYSDNQDILSQPLTFYKIQQLRDKLEPEKWSEFSARVTGLPCIRERYELDNLEQINRLLADLALSETQSFNDVGERLFTALDNIADEINNLPETEKDAACDLYNPILEAFNAKPADSMTALKEATAQLQSALSTEQALQVLVHIPSLDTLKQTIHLLHNDRNSLLEAASKENQLDEVLFADIEDALYSFETALDSLSEAEETAARAIYDPLITAFNTAPLDTIVDKRVAVSQLKVGLNAFEMKRFFQKRPELSDLLNAMNRLNGDGNLFKCVEITPEEMRTTGRFVDQVHHNQARIQAIDTQLPALEEKRDELARHLKAIDEGDIDTSFQSSIIQALMNDCKKPTIRHAEVRVALKNFLSYPTARLFSNFKDALSKNPNSLTSSTVGPLLQRAGEIYPQIEHACQTVNNKTTSAELKEQIEHLKPSETETPSGPRPPGSSNNPIGGG